MAATSPAVEALINFCNEPEPDRQHDTAPYDTERLDELGLIAYEEGDPLIRNILASASFESIMEGFVCHNEQEYVDLEELAYKLKNRTSIPRHVGIDFCSECNNMLHPAESADRTRLVFKCRSCQNEVERANAFCVYVNNISEDIESLTRMNPDVIADPTLPHSRSKPCPQCAHEDAVYFQAQVNREKSNMQLFYVCCQCRHQWRDHVEKPDDTADDGEVPGY
ncbi:hypothetical protein PTSG_10432 [Salpingoeca rosetta]|uniref:TFIIS-type domain-containing protein n=1 Tax=Salpingoeca rosetta (strain ATCC 50818 / BSB-021) TaxID=946362 RepID=F2UPM8_SALR5|nr:uncharacterized protein PTSG_10432 [Salpingoeca rosetta]EGD79583.1 hypothetical protein PTSG_10432 [Salpingoeca rosetta]|eukprot:XP_004988811.1 hypothetical protein PTSG_10432 [Salpingoeca rosetta]